MYYKDLEVWKEAISLVTEIYNITNKFPKEEIYGITSQIRHCAVSIPSNIAEGVVKHSDKETLRFLDISLGSISELDTQIIIAGKLKYIDNYEEINIKISKVRALLIGLIKYYKKQDPEISQCLSTLVS